MSKENKKQPEKKKEKRGKRGKYDPKLAIKGTFAEVIKIAVSDKQNDDNKK